MATVPTPLDATAGVKISATTFDAGVRDPLNFLLDPPHCTISDGVGISLPNNTATLMTYDTETDDTDSMHSTSSNTSRIVFTTGGRYQIGINNILPAPLGTGIWLTLVVNIRLNSAGSSSGGSSIRSFTFNGYTARQTPPMMLSRLFTAADYVEIFITQQTSAGTSVTTSGGAGAFACGVQASWVGIN